MKMCRIPFGRVGVRNVKLALVPIFLPDSQNIQRAADLLRHGELVAFPTETVYGLGASALDANAVQKIFDAKERPSYNPLIVHVLDAESVQELVTDWPAKAQLLAERFWPGALTFVLPKRAIVPDIVTAGLESVAVRAPSHPVARALLQASNLPIAAPSANRFTQLSPTTAAHVEAALGERIPMILDGGDCDCGIESTVLDLTGEIPILLRPGTISRTQIEEIIGEIKLRDDIEYSKEEPRLSPGLIHRHYAPRAKLIRFQNAVELRHYLAQHQSKKTGALLLNAKNAAIDHPIAMPHNAPDYARRLYGALHNCDELGCSVVFVEDVPPQSMWDGVRDRLKRASTPA